MPTASFICWANHLLSLISNLPIYQGKILTKYISQLFIKNQEQLFQCILLGEVAPPFYNFIGSCIYCI